VVQVRAARGGLVLHQLLYADQVRSPEQLQLDLPDVGDAELQLALQLIEQGARDAYDPHEFVDEEKQRILQAVQQKIAGRRIVSHAEPAPAAVSTGAEVIDLLAALRASLRAGATARPLPARKPVQRARHKTASASSKPAEPTRKRKATR
jgi:DNA end-binding protein Ku